jgi:lipopolysaccharide transport system permease protein
MKLKTTLRNIFSNYFLIKNLTKKDLKIKYSGSAMGLIWTIIHPLMLLIVYSVVFSWMLKVKVGMELGTNNFTVWLFCGLLPWIFFADSINRSTSIVIDNTNLIKKTTFPSEILPVVILLSNGINFLIGLVILIITILITGHHFYISSLFIMAVYILPLILFSLGLSWLMSSLNVFLRDIGQIVAVIINLWFYLTTIIYPKSVIPTKYQGVFFWNPLTHVVEGVRSALLKNQFTGITELIYLYLFSIVAFVFGQYIFQKLKKGFVDVL